LRLLGDAGARCGGGRAELLVELGALHALQSLSPLVEASWEGGEVLRGLGSGSSEVDGGEALHTAMNARP
jgi:hypothetical protein